MTKLKHKNKGPQSLTANHLTSGLSMWMTRDLDWSTDFSRALKTTDPDLIEKMRLAGERDSDTNLVVGVYFIDIEVDSRLPVRYREKFRINGPSYDTADHLEAGASHVSL